MSIVAATAGGPPLWVWITWLIVAAGVAMMSLLRPRRGAGAAVDPGLLRPNVQAVPLLAITGVASFCAWVAAQLIYLSVRPPDGSLASSPADLVRLSLIAAVAGWALGFGLIVYGGGVRAIGYGVRRVPSGMLAGAVGVFVALPIVYFTLEATLALWTALHVEHPARHELLEVMQRDSRRWVRGAAVASAAVVAPLFEELLFRGCLQGGLRRATGSPWLAIVVASLLFASIHPKWTIPPIFVFSLLLGLTYERTRNLWATTFMHALFNLFSVLNSGMNPQ